MNDSSEFQGDVMGICYIVGAGAFWGDFTPTDDDLVIAADGGLDTLRSLDIRADLAIGDFDSLGRIPSGIETIRFKVEKDETDMHLAYLEGKRRGYRSFRIYGGVGGRVDHTFANYCLLAYIAAQGDEAILYDREYIARAITNNSTRVVGGDGKGVSVFAFGGEAVGVTIKGLYYEAEDITLSPSFPLGASNHKTACDAQISVKDGTLLIFEEI